MRHHHPGHHKQRIVVTQTLDRRIALIALTTSFGLQVYAGTVQGNPDGAMLVAGAKGADVEGGPRSSTAQSNFQRRELMSLLNCPGGNSDARDRAVIVWAQYKSAQARDCTLEMTVVHASTGEIDEIRDIDLPSCAPGPAICLLNSSEATHIGDAVAITCVEGAIVLQRYPWRSREALPFGRIAIKESPSAIAITACRDFDGDKQGDLLVSALFAQSVSAVVVSGRTGSSLRSIAYECKPMAGAVAGAVIDDANGDNVADICLGLSPGLLDGGPGRIGLWSGKDGSLIYCKDGIRPKGWLGSADGPSANYGQQVLQCSDVNGDGVRDLIVVSSGIPGLQHDAEYWSIVSGKTGDILSTHGEPDLMSFGQFVLCPASSKNVLGASVVVSGYRLGKKETSWLEMIDVVEMKSVWKVGYDSAAMHRGLAMVSVGDYNEDSVPDILCVSRSAGGSGRDMIELLSGKSGDILWSRAVD